MDSNLEKPQDQRGEGFPQILHDRARTAAEELHKLLLSLSTGGVGVFFVALTGKTEPALSGAQRVAVLGAVISMAAAALSGITCWYADCRRNYYWASALQSDDRSKRSQLYRQRDRWLKREKITANCLMALFVSGILAAMVYMTLRIVGK